MPTMEEDLVSRLLENETVAGLIGDRVYPVNQVPSTIQYPLIVYQRVSTVPVKILTGTTGLERARFQLSIWSKQYSETKTVANAVKAALDGNNGQQLENEVDRFDDDIDTNYTVLDFSIWNG